MNAEGTTNLQTRPWLCAFTAAVVFASLGFVDFVPEFNKGGGLRYWQCWTYTWEHFDDASLLYVGIFTAVLAIPAIALGWVAHCIVVILFARLAERRIHSTAKERQK